MLEISVPTALMTLVLSAFLIWLSWPMWSRFKKKGLYGEMNKLAFSIGSVCGFVSISELFIITLNR